ncbi:hypothetical protein [Enterocloster lavalensis]|uniref:hypothetical protein n=1 Tax=Enterocloster lavalensis TaxID=460384 RepID=UPI0034A52C6B
MKAVKGNKEYTINEASQKGYQDMGFDILDEDGKIVAYGRGKTVPYGDYVSLMEENKKLHSRIAELEAEISASGPEKKAGRKKAGE